MKIFTIVSISSAMMSGLVTWMINYGIANGQTVNELANAGRERERIERQMNEKIDEIAEEDKETRKKVEENEKKIERMYGDIRATKDAVERIEKRLSK